MQIEWKHIKSAIRGYHLNGIEPDVIAILVDASIAVINKVIEELKKENTSNG